MTDLYVGPYPVDMTPAEARDELKLLALSKALECEAERVERAQEAVRARLEASQC